MDQAKGMIKSGPHTDYERTNLTCHVNNASILAETKLEILNEQLPNATSVH